jgi:dihydrofolate reductase
MRKIILVVHVSIDGFVAGINGEFDDFDPSPENLELVCGLTEEADAFLMGRISYQLLESNWPNAWKKPNATDSEIKYSNWYNKAEKIVVSNSLSQMDAPNVTILGGDNIVDEILKIKKEEGKNILMYGSPSTFQMLNDLNVIDEYRIILYPAIFGKGILLFSQNQMPKKLKLLSTRQLSKGEILLSYKTGV